jgi:hypothetical protein
MAGARAAATVAAAPDETAGGLAVPGPGVRVAGAEDVEAAEPAHRSLYVNTDRAPAGRRRLQAAGRSPPVVCVQQREVTRVTSGCLCSELP